MDFYIGVDPGGSGGLACLDEGGALMWVSPMPPTEKDLLYVLASWHDQTTRAGGVRAMLEQAQPFPGQGVVSVATYMRNFGHLEMALTAASIPFDTVSPIKWQNAMQCRTHGDKNISKRRAQMLFPDLRVTHALADALLLAEYGRRLHRGLLAPRSQTNGEAKGRTDQGQGQAPPGRQTADAPLPILHAQAAERTARPDPSRDGTRPGQPARRSLSDDRRRPGRDGKAP
jgi:hypothetical protein